MNRVREALLNLRSLAKDDKETIAALDKMMPEIALIIAKNDAWAASEGVLPAFQKRAAPDLKDDQVLLMDAFMRTPYSEGSVPIWFIAAPGKEPEGTTQIIALTGDFKGSLKELAEYLHNNNFSDVKKRNSELGQVFADMHNSKITHTT